jgi:hypothetical protein
MGATEEQMALLATLGVSHVAYILVIYSIAFLLFLFVCMLLQIYANHAWPIEPGEPLALNKGDGRLVNGSAGGLNGHARDRDRRIRDAEEFELEGLMSEDEGEREFQRESQAVNATL